MKTCKVCGAIFSPRDYRQSICSDECRKVANKKRCALHRQKHPIIKNNCVLCGAETKGFICMGSECRKIYHQVYSWTQQRYRNDIRASGKKYVNPPEKIQAIKEKYKNGVSVATIKAMLE